MIRSVMGLTLSVHPDDRYTVVRVGGEIDLCLADPLQEGLLRIMRAHSTRLLLDLSAVSFMDCAGLQALGLTGRRAELRGGSMHLIAVSRAVRRIIDLTGQRNAFPVHDPRRGSEDTWTSPMGRQLAT
ncbi:MAG TPA: STAS domain-containing protein [Streptosporangiaceae bacterium]